jgi:branched-subunit amino acid transport protein
MSNNTRLKVAAYAVLGAYSLVLFLLNIHLPSTAQRLLGLLPAAILIAFAIFDNWLWRQGPILKLVKQPLLNGTWSGTLVSLRRNEQGESIRTEHPVVVVIRQTLTSVSVTFMTEESRSKSSAAQITAEDRDDYVLQYQYRNEPSLEFRSRSPIHPGGAQIRIGGSRPYEVDGEYWTGRESRGTFHLERLSKKHVTSFKDGQIMTPREGTASR